MRMIAKQSCEERGLKQKEEEGLLRREGGGKSIDVRRSD